MRILICLLSLYLLFSPAWSQVKKAKIDGNLILSYIKILADDSFEGRRSGLLGAVKAENYIAKKFKEWGIKPAGEKNSYFQNVTIEFFNIERGVNLEIFNGKRNRKFIYYDDWRVQKFSGSGDFESEIVFAGYGIFAPDKGYNDYSGIDVKGKIVLIRRGFPKKLEEKLKKEGKMENRIKYAQKFGAKGIFIARSPTDRSRYYRLRLGKEIYKSDFVIISISENVANFIFEDLPTDLRYLYSEIDKNSEPKSFLTGVKAKILVKTTFDEKRQTRNILGKIEGVDEKLKNEFIIIGAHMDHLGLGPEGDIMNGANDNASGTAVVMELARFMKAMEVQPRRTIVFALWCAEEQGLLGSKYYNEHPLYPLEKTIAYFNLDMVGHGSGKINFRGIYYGPEIWRFLKENLDKESLESINPGRGGPGGSDHTYFLRNGVPGFALMTDGFHFKYHRYRDDWDLIKPELLEKTASFVYNAVVLLSKSEESFILPKRRERYIWKSQNIINFHTLSIPNALEKLKDIKDSDVDLQLLLPEERQDLTLNEMRLDILKQLDRLQTETQKSKGLRVYSNASMVSSSIRRGKTTLIAGLRGISLFKEDFSWLRIFSRQGINYVILEDRDLHFRKNEIDDRGKALIKAINEAKLLLLVSTTDENKLKEIMKSSSKPVVILSEKVPSEDCLKILKEKGHVLGLKFCENDNPSDYFKKLALAKEKLGTENLTIWNEKCLWSEEGQSKYLALITSLIKGKWERQELSAIFSGAFIGALSKAREEGPPRPFAYIPF